MSDEENGPPSVSPELSLGRRVGFHIRLLRSMKRLSQQYVAYQLGLTQSSLSLIERGKRSVKVDFLEKVANFFDMPPSLLLNLCTSQENPEEVLRESLEVFSSVPMGEGDDLDEALRN